MGLSIISNFAANVAHRNLVSSEAAASASLARLSSGQRIVSAKDDAASLAIGSRLAAEVGALKQAGVNASQAGSMLQIADGAFAKANDILIRMKVLAVQAASGQLGATERAVLDVEFQALKNEITRIGNDTEFNGVKLVNGSQSITAPATFTGALGLDAIRSNGLNAAAVDSSMTVVSTAGTTTFTFTNDGNTFTATLDNTDTAIFDTATSLLLVPKSITLTSSDAQVTGSITLDLNTAFNNGTSTIAAATATVAGSSTTSFTFKVGTGSVASEDDVTFAIDSLVAVALAVAGNLTGSTGANADVASTQVTAAIDSLTTSRAILGANQSRLDFAGVNVATVLENTEAARSQLLDLDVASEMTIFTSKSILLQSGVSMLAQANQIPQALLRLFQ